MPVTLKREKPPEEEPVSVSLFKSHVRKDTAEDDDLIGLYLQAARIKVENFLGRSLVTQSYVQFLDHFPHFPDFQHAARVSSTEMWGGRGYVEFPRYGRIKLLRSPLVKVSRITYIDVTAASVDLFPTPGIWLPETEFEDGDQVKDSNGNLQEVTGTQENAEDSSSSSGTTAPTWSTDLAHPNTTDGTLTWKLIQTPAPAGDFIVDRFSEPGRLYPLAGARWPYTLVVPGAVAIHFTAGYGNDGANVPATYKVAVLQTAANFYEFREPVSSLDMRPIPGHLRDLLWLDRIVDFSPTGSEER
jgi:hypothetical protein